MHLLIRVSELSCDIRTGGCLGCNEHTVMEFTLLKDMGQKKSKIRMLSFRKAHFQLFRDLVNKTLWESVLKHKELEQS